jgi:hypothetical protein
MNFVFPELTVLASEFIVRAPSYSEASARLYLNQHQFAQSLASAPSGQELDLNSVQARQAIFDLLSNDRQIIDNCFAESIKQVETCRDLSMLFPSGALSFGGADLAGTGALAYRRYLSSLQGHRDNIIAAIQRQFEATPPDRGSVEGAIRETLSQESYSYPAASCLRPVAWSALSLAAWIGLMALSAFWRMRVCDVR